MTVKERLQKNKLIRLIIISVVDTFAASPALNDICVYSRFSGEGTSEFTSSPFSSTGFS